MRLKIISIIFILCISLFPEMVSAKDTSKSSIVMDIDTGRILYEKNPEERRLIASTTKIMTAILTIENCNLNEFVVVGDEVLRMYGTNIYIEVGERITVKDLLYGLLLRSGNDAATVLANHVGESEEKFVAMMNNKAKLLGMNNTIFENPHGLDDDTKNYSTAHDMALLSAYAMKNPTYREISSTKKYSTKTENKSYLWYNRNKLLSTYEFCTGGKNGYTPNAGRTLVTTATKNNLNLTVVTLNDANEYATHQTLYETAFSKYYNYVIVDKDKFIIDDNKYKNLAYIKSSFKYPLTKSEKESITTEISLLDKPTSSQKIGYITIKLSNQKIGQVNIYQRRKDQEKKDSSILSKFKNYFSDILKKLMLG